MEVKTIAIVGGGELANAIKENACDNCKIDIIGHSEFDITSQEQSNNIISKLSKYNVVIITAGNYSTDLWNMWMTNTVGPCYLIAKLNEVSKNQQIIAVSSHGASWTSWPNISSERLNYNASKSALNEFLSGLIHQGTTTNKISVVEPGKFSTHMSGYQGASVTIISSWNDPAQRLGRCEIICGNNINLIGDQNKMVTIS